jgi:hypothetical protein
MSLIPYRKNIYVGFCMPDKTIVIEPKFDEAFPFINGFAWVKFQGKWGIIKEVGTYQIEPKYDNIDTPYLQYYSPERPIRVGVGDKSGVIINNVEIVAPIYDFNPLQVTEGVFMVVKDEKVGYINSHQKFIIPFGDNTIFNNSFSTNGKANWLQKENTIWNIHTNQTIAINEIFDGFERELENTNAFLCYKKQENKILYGIQDISGKVIFEPILGYVWHENDGFLNVGINNLQGMYTYDFKEIFPIEYHTIIHFKDDIFTCFIDEKCILLNLKREQVFLEYIPKSAQINLIYNTYQYIEFIDKGNLNYCDFDGKIFFSIPVAEISEKHISGTYVVKVGYGPLFALITKTKTYVLDIEKHTFITLDFTILFIRFFDSTYANIIDENGREYLYNLQNGENNYPFIITLANENYYIISDKAGNYGAMDKDSNITMPLGDFKIGFNHINFGNYHRFFIQRHNKTYEHDAYGYPYWVDVIKNIVYAEDLPVIEPIDIQTIKDYKKIEIEIPETDPLYLFWKNKPTKRWRKSLKEGDVIFTERNIKDTEIVLDAFIYKLYKLPNDKLESVKQVLLDIQDLQRKHSGFIETLEREELYVFLRDASIMEGFGEIFEEFKSF